MVNQLGMTFSALAEPTRFQVIEMLRGRDLSAGELAARCSTTGPAMSRHLRVLRKSGLIEVVQTPRAEKDARLRVYRLRPQQLPSLQNWVDTMQQVWTRRLAAFKEYAAQQSKPGKRGPSRETENQRNR